MQELTYISIVLFQLFRKVLSVHCHNAEKMIE